MTTNHKQWDISKKTQRVEFRFQNIAHGFVPFFVDLNVRLLLWNTLSQQYPINKHSPNPHFYPKGHSMNSLFLPIYCLMKTLFTYNRVAAVKGNLKALFCDADIFVLMTTCALYSMLTITSRIEGVCFLALKTKTKWLRLSVSSLLLLNELLPSYLCSFDCLFHWVGSDHCNVRGFLLDDLRLLVLLLPHPDLYGTSHDVHVTMTLIG